MSSIPRALSVSVALCVATAAGMGLQTLIAPEVLNASKGAVGAMTGIMGLLLALVLGLLIWTAFGVFVGQQADALSLGPIIAEIDLLLESIGAEGAGGRLGLRAALERSRQRFFGSGATGPQMLSIAEIKAIRGGMNSYFENQTLSEEAHRRRFQSAGDLARRYQDTQTTMLIRLASPFPARVLDIVVVWAALLFLGAGLVSPPNVVAIAANFAGACGIGTAVFLILELSHPYTGFIKLTPEGLDRVIQTLEEAHRGLAA